MQGLKWTDMQAILIYQVRELLVVLRLLEFEGESQTCLVD